MLDWNDLRYCIQVARDGSTLAAGKSLKTSQTTVMRRIAALEAELGVELFEKRRAGYLPTPQLLSLMPQLEAIEAAHTAFLREAAHAARSLSGTVRVTSSELLVSHLLSAPLAEFSKLHPEIKIELYTTDGFLDLSRGEADIAIRAGDAPTEPSLFGRRLSAEDSWSVCCSKSYAANHHQPPTTDDLKSHPMLTVMEGLYQSPITPWLRAHVPPERIAFRHNSLTSIYMSVKAGLGLSPIPDVLSAFDADLVRCMPLGIDTGKELWILAPERLKNSRHVRLLMDFLTARLVETIKRGEQRASGKESLAETP